MNRGWIYDDEYKAKLKYNTIIKAAIFCKNMLHVEKKCYKLVKRTKILWGV